MMPWSLGIVTSANSSTASMLGKPAGNGDWTSLMVDESGQIKMPLAEGVDGKEADPIGMVRAYLLCCSQCLCHSIM